MPELILRELKNGDEVTFVPHTKNYGRAEFAFCPVWKRGEVMEVYIYPCQQPDSATEYWVVKSGFSTSFQVNAWTHKGIDNPWHWIYTWCKEHKCMSFRSYVPNQSNKFTVQVMSTLAIHFDRAEGGKIEVPS